LNNFIEELFVLKDETFPPILELKLLTPSHELKLFPLKLHSDQNVGQIGSENGVSAG